MKHRVTSEARQASLDSLRRLLPPGSTVYAVERSRSRSGLSRRVDFYRHTPDGMRYLSGMLWNLGYGRGRHPNEAGHKTGLVIDGSSRELVAGLGAQMNPPCKLYCEVL